MSRVTYYRLHAYEYPMNCTSNLAFQNNGPHLFLVIPLSIRLRRVVSLVHNQIFWAVVFPTTEVAFENSLGSGSISLLRIERGTGHVRYHGVSASKRILGVAKRVFLWCWLWEPDITAIAAEMTGFESLGDVFLDDDGATSSVDKP